MRSKRLAKDYLSMLDLHNKSKLISIDCFGEPPVRYNVIYYCRSLVWLDGNQTPSYSSRHQLEIYLHKDYPRLPPLLKWLTDIYHPNILPPQRNGGVCIGGWTAAETLDGLCLRIGEMLQYKNYNLLDPLNEDAARWIQKNRDFLPLDNRNLL